MADDNRLIGLKEIRKARHINQQKLAFDLNISREAISYYENGKRSPDVGMLKKMATYFGVTIDYLVFGEQCNK